MNPFSNPSSLAGATPVPLQERIFCNRNLRMERIRAIGFDLDHTLAHYNGPQVEQLAYNLTRDRLVSMGYPEELRDIPYEGDFVIRGLVVDKRRGHILKMDYHNYVTRAYRGRRQLASEERKKVYKSGRIRMSGGTYASLDTLFHLPEVFLFAILVEMRESGKVRASFKRIYKDVRAAIDGVHGDGSLKAEICGNLDVYVRRDPRLAQLLEQFRMGGKKLFLLTNSEMYYSNEILGYLLNQNGTRWTEAFDVIGVEARKPGFFTGKRSFDNREEDPHGGAPTVTGGNAQEFEELLGFSGDEVLYFGDHTYGDILRSKRSVGWRTAMVAEELEREMTITRAIKERAGEWAYWASVRDALEGEASHLESRRLHLEKRLAAGENHTVEAQLNQVRDDLADGRRKLAEAQDRTVKLEAEVSAAYNPNWGPLFKEGNKTSRFAHQVRDFACIYMARVTNFLSYGHDHYFRAASERMPHELEV